MGIGSYIIANSESLELRAKRRSAHGLDVLSGQVGDAAGWGVAADSGVGSVVVVAVKSVGGRLLVVRRLR
ncbi:hypothetical protein Stsp01_66580 [Streptomyces sp. NBRC 13847]|nr:hypothetical protein Stsp01_66580 [Streptomyces sp. NBRC 13847]